jgi:two-component system chemotaxis response regulator CheB
MASLLGGFAIRWPTKRRQLPHGRAQSFRLRLFAAHAMRGRAGNDDDPHGARIASVATMRKHDIFVIGASHGGVIAVRTLLAALPKTFAGAILVVIHTRRSASNGLASVIGHGCGLHVKFAVDGEHIRPGVVYVAPPDGHHLVIEAAVLRLVANAKEHHTRPSIDPLFRSVATAFGERVVGVLLTGYGRDGAAGMRAIHQAGGVCVVQHPNDALGPAMPAAVLSSVDCDYCLPLSDIPPLLCRLADPEAVAGGMAPGSQEAAHRVSPIEEASDE